MATVTVSVISAVYNKSKQLPGTLESLRNLEVPQNVSLEFVFVDDGSTDGSPEMLSEAAEEDPRIVVIRNAENMGPSIRLNQAANIAKGDYFLPIDADDFLPPNGLAFLLGVVEAHDAPLVFGRSARAANAPRIPANTNTIVIDRPLVFCATRQLVRMGFLVQADLWRKAGGADETIFIQDQSLPLRLCACALKMAFVEGVVYWLSIADGDNLSANIMQQHHDRFLACDGVYSKYADALDGETRAAILKQMVSANWKARRDADKPFAIISSAFFLYLANRMFGVTPSAHVLAGIRAKMLALPNIRRV